MGKKRERTGSKPTRYFDYSLLFIIIFLVCFGLVMLYSTSFKTSGKSRQKVSIRPVLTMGS